MSELPAAPRNAKALLVKAETYEALRQAAKNQLIPDEEDFITQTRNGKKFVRLRAKYIDPNMDAPPCPFGKVVRQEGVLKLVGGVVFVGETNLTLASIPLSTTANTGHWLYLSIVFTANHADNTLLPGVESIVSHTIAHGAVPTNVLPTVDQPDGTIRIPLGFYTESTVSGRPPIFTPSGCGDVTIEHCPGTIGFSRA